MAANEFCSEQSMQNSQDQGMHGFQLQHPTQLIDNLRNDDYLNREHENFSSLLNLIAQEAQQDTDLGALSVIAFGGKPLSGKTGVLQHAAMEVVHKITSQEWKDLTKQPELGKNGKQVEVYLITWSDCIKAAVKMGLLTMTRYGDWSADQLKLITQVLNTTVQVASDQLATLLPESRSDSIKLLFIDAPFITGDEFDRGLTFLLNRIKNPDTKKRTYFVGVELTDVHSQAKRLKGRQRYKDVQESQDQVSILREWQEEYGVDLEEDDQLLKQIAEYLYLSSGSPYTAAVITIHANMLILKLYKEKKITLTPRIILSLREEIFFLQTDYDLLSPEVMKRQNLTLSIVCRELFRYLIDTVGADKERVYVGENADIPELNAYFSLQLHHSLIPKILEAEEKKMSQLGATGVYSKLVPPANIGNPTTL